MSETTVKIDKILDDPMLAGPDWDFLRDPKKKAEAIRRVEEDKRRNKTK